MLKHLLTGSLVLCACSATCPPCAQPPHGANNADAWVGPHEQTAGFEPSPSVRPGAGAVGTVPAAMGRDARTTEVIAAVVVQHRQSVRRCYEAARAHTPSLQGTLTMRFTLDSKGRVTSAVINPERSNIDLPSLTQCAANALRQMPFPPSSRGFESTVNYPFNFKP